MGVKETPLQDKIIKYLIKNRIWHFRYQVSNVYGLPDIIAIYHGYFIGIEVKAEDGSGKPSGLQEAVVASVREAGGYADIIDSMDKLKELLASVQT